MKISKIMTVLWDKASSSLHSQAWYRSGIVHNQHHLARSEIIYHLQSKALPIHISSLAPGTNFLALLFAFLNQTPNGLIDDANT